MKVRSSNLFMAGNVLPAQHPSYIERDADKIVLAQLQSGHYCYVLAAPRSGKSSLLYQAAKRLEAQQVKTAIIPFGLLNQEAKVENWYLDLVDQLTEQLQLTRAAKDWWTQHSSVQPTQRFTNFWREVVLNEVQAPLVIFFDEIEILGHLKFAPDFLRTLRSMYEARSSQPGFQRLTFAFSGAVFPTDLIKDSAHSPFTIAHKVYLPDFSRKETGLFQEGLVEHFSNQAEAIFSRVFYWTNGQPYLTQKLCLELVNLSARLAPTGYTDQTIDRLVENLFVNEVYGPEVSLQRLRESLSNHPYQRQILNLYRQVYEGQDIAANEQSVDQMRLLLVGLVRIENGLLKIHNPIYRQIFNLNWLKDQGQPGWARYAAITLIVAGLILVGVIGFLIYRQVKNLGTIQAQSVLTNFDQVTTSNERLTSLASLFNSEGYQEKARQTFFDGLTPEDQLAVFEQTDPHRQTVELITVIRGVYGSPKLKDSEQGETLLRIMTKQLDQVTANDASASEAVTLGLEINQWLKGRDFYRREDYKQAVSSFNYAVELNSRNPGVYFDRALAYAALEQPDTALNDLITALNLDESWQTHIEQVLFNNSQLYTALWQEPANYKNLTALVPTPTSTPTPTPTSTFTPTPSPTPTLPRPTATVTVIPTPTPTRGAVTVIPDTPTPALTLAPSSDIPAGTFTLLGPLSKDDPTYGPTTFDWKWSGTLPSDYGFEVRVWREGAQPAGVHNAVLDNQNGNVKNLGNNKYQLTTNIENAAGVQKNSGLYWWTVALVRINPKYRDMGIQADPAQLRFAAAGPAGDGKNGGGGVGIK